MRKNIRFQTPPAGFRYQTDVLPLDEEQELVEHIRGLPLKEFEFHGFVGKRRTLYPCKLDLTTPVYLTVTR